MKGLVAQQCPPLCDPRHYGPPGSSVHGISQARILKWVAIPSSRGIFQSQGSNPRLPHCRQILYHLLGLGNRGRAQGTFNCQRLRPAGVCNWTYMMLICQPAQLPAPWISFPKPGQLHPRKVRPCPAPGLIKTLRGVDFKRIWFLEPLWLHASFLVNGLVPGRKLLPFEW